MAKRGGQKKGFVSRKQWRWAFATKQPWARRKARETPGPRKVRYRRLPVRKGTRKAGRPRR
ncbi:hypothetical protein GCM10023085_45550 [Actinomadura viridis]|uniref:Uncharacterized protein n=1 Tax=Actinomadura viridis TaxID=58110 RepID=A0A931GK74_9ACTN|nr:hypothetical protein [Actinomadura viridis]